MTNEISVVSPMTLSKRFSVKDMHLAENTLTEIILWTAENNHRLPSDEQVRKFREEYKDQPCGEWVLCITDVRAGKAKVYFVEHYWSHKGEMEANSIWIKLTDYFDGQSEFMFV